MCLRCHYQSEKNVQRNIDLGYLSHIVTKKPLVRCVQFSTDNLKIKNGARKRRLYGFLHVGICLKNENGCLTSRLNLQLVYLRRC